MFDSTLQDVLSQLEAKTGFAPRRSGSGFMARCPCHDDRTASLSVAIGDGGRILLNCHAGCAFDDVVSAAGLEAKQMHATTSGPANGNGYHATTWWTADEAITASSRRFGRPPDAKWQYSDELRAAAGFVLRWNTTAGKEIRQVSRHAGTWTCKAMPTPRPLYRLPEVSLSPEVWCFEGEKCADLAVQVGLCATTSAGGAKAADKTDWSPLAGKMVYLVPDANDAGESYITAIQATLANLSPPPNVLVVRLCGIAAGDDLEQWLDLHDAKTPEELAGLLRSYATPVDLTAFHEAEPNTTPDASSKPASSRNAATNKKPRKSRRLDMNRPFPVDLLPRVVLDLVASASRAFVCDPAFVALPALAAVASVIGSSRRVRIKMGWSEPGILWTATVGPSGDKKTPAMACAVKPLYELQRHAFREQSHLLNEFEVEKLRHDILLRKWKNSPDGDPPAAPDKPASPRFVVSDTTIEGLAAVLRDSPRGVLLCRDELDAWLGSFDRYASGRGSDVPAWLSIFNARPIVVDRRTSGIVAVDTPAVSICGGIQPTVLRKALRGHLLDCGLGGRFLFAMPPRSKGGWSDSIVQPSVEAAYASLFDELASLESVGGGKPAEVPLSGDALQRFKSHVNDIATRKAEASDAMAGILSKLEAAAARLALVVELGNRPDADFVGDDSVEAGIVLANWFAAEAERILGVVADNEDDDRLRQLAEWIASRNVAEPTRITGRELQQGRRDVRSSEDAHAALAELAEAGYGTFDLVQPPTGRPAFVFRLLHASTSTEVAESPEIAASVDVDGVDNTKTDGGACPNCGGEMISGRITGLPRCLNAGCCESEVLPK